ncbi:MAG: DUF488 family protein [Terriglobia bacterium]
MTKMTSTLYTIGFTKKTAEQFFGLLEQAGVRRVIDVRENRGGQLSGFAKHPDLAYFLDRLLGIGYVHEPLLAPSQEIRDAYRATKNWEQYEASFQELMQARNALESIVPEQFEGNVALLCSEAEPDKCHRRLVAEMLARAWNGEGHSVEVKHLVIPKPASRRTRRHGSPCQKSSSPILR